MKKSELKRMLRPIVEELIQESLEEILSDSDFLNEVVKESVLKTGILTEVTSQVMTAFTRQGHVQVVSEQSADRYKSADDIAEGKWREHNRQARQENMAQKNRAVIEGLSKKVGLDVFNDVMPIKEEIPADLPLSVYINSGIEVTSEAQARNPILAADPNNTGGVPLSVLDRLTDVSQFKKKAGIK